MASLVSPLNETEYIDTTVQISAQIESYGPPSAGPFYLCSFRFDAPSP